MPNKISSEIDSDSQQNLNQDVRANIPVSDVTSTQSQKVKFNPLLPVVILLFIIILGGSYYVYQKFIKIEAKQEMTNEDSNAQDTTDDSEVIKNEEEDKEISYVKKTFTLTTKSTEVVAGETINNEMEIPSNWTYSTEVLPSGTVISDCSKHIITSDDSKMIISITPKCSSWKSSIISKPNNNVIGTYTALGNDGVHTISVVRIGIDSTNYSYIQGSSISGSEAEYNNTFLVEKHGNLASDGDPVFWAADINTKYIGESVNAKTYLDISDKIVLSLQIK